MFIDVSHTWQSEGTYTISVQVIDAHEAWGPVTTLSVTMPRNRLINNPMFTKFMDGFMNRFPLFARLLKL